MMKLLLAFIAVLFLIVVSNPVSAQEITCADITEISAQECAVLQAMHDFGFGHVPHATHAGWFHSTTPCDWGYISAPKTYHVYDKISCDDAGHIVGLEHGFFATPPSDAYPAFLAAQLPYLTSLSLQNYQTISADIHTLSTVETLTVHHPFRWLPPEIGRLPNLRHLTIYSSELRALPTTIGDVRQLNSLHLSSAKIQALPNSIGNLVNLRELTIENSELRALPLGFGRLQNLERFTLYNNKHFWQLPDSIGQLKQLKHLQLSVLPLTKLPNSIGQLSQLEHLEINLTEIATLPNSIENLSKLNTVFLKQMSIKTVPEVIGRIDSLERLYIQYNKQLTKVPASLNTLRNLTHLFIEKNPTLQSIPASLAETSFPKMRVYIVDVPLVESTGCIIPDSGPWPSCATGGEQPEIECVIPESGPWPPCAIGDESVVTKPCVIPENGPWPACARRHSTLPKTHQ